MSINQIACLTLLAGALVWTPGTGFGQDTTKKSHIPLQKTIGEVTATAPVPSLFVLNSGGAKLEGNKLILTDVSANTIVFADRPIRSAGHEMTDQFLMQWDEGKNSFAVDPPNATVSVLGGGNGSEVIDAVVTIKSPKLEGTTLTFEIALLEGNLDGAAGPAALFIDRGGGGRGGFGGGFGGDGGFGDRGDGFGGDMGGAHAGGYWNGGAWHNGNYWHAPEYHGAWYSREDNWNSGHCGYYPNPPCPNR